MLIAEYMINGGDLDELRTTHRIKSSRHAKYPNLVLFKYAAGCDFDDPMVCECRGVILDENDNWKVISLPYTKFFNHGEPQAHEIDWETARVYDKLDGSLMTAFHYNGEWLVSSSGKADASGPMNDEVTFAAAFAGVWLGLGYEDPEDFLDTEFCYMFELCSPMNRVVVPYSGSNLILHGARNMRTLKEWDVSIIAEDFGFIIPAQYPLYALEDAIDSANELSGSEAEGYVVCDKNFNRIKIKGQDYLRLHRMRDTATPRFMLECIRMGDPFEAIHEFPELKPEYDQVREVYDDYVLNARMAYKVLDGIEDQKEFAQAVVGHSAKGAMFALRSGKVMSIEDYYARVPIKSLEKSLGLKEEECQK